MYYNKEEQLMTESVPVVIRGRRDSEDCIIPNPKNAHEEKMEMQQYYGKRRFVLESLKPRERAIFLMYYGLIDGKFVTQEEISKKYQISTSRIGQILATTYRKLRHPYRIRPCIYLTDDEVGYNEETKDNFYDSNKVRKLFDEKVAQINIDRINNIPAQQKAASIVLNKILSMDITEELGSVQKFAVKNSINTYRYEHILNMDIETLKNHGLGFLIDKIHSMGLIFKCEAKYVEEWETKCRLGIMEIGVDKFMESFNTQPPQTNNKKEVDMNNITKFDDLMEIFIEDLGLTVRSYNCLKRAGVDCLEEVITRSEGELARIRNLGKKCLVEIESMVASYGLELRPEYTGEKEWLQELRQKFEAENIDTQQADTTIAQSANRTPNTKATNVLNNAMNINEIPEKYRKTYAIGAGVVASQQVGNSRLFTQAIENRQASSGLEHQPVTAKVKLSKQPTIQELIEEANANLEFAQYQHGTDSLIVKAIRQSKEQLEAKQHIQSKVNERHVAQYVGENILAIYDLEPNYIAIHKDELIDFILNNQNVEPDERLKLIKFIRDTKKDGYTL